MCFVAQATLIPSQFVSGCIHVAIAGWVVSTEMMWPQSQVFTIWPLQRKFRTSVIRHQNKSYSTTNENSAKPIILNTLKYPYKWKRSHSVMSNFAASWTAPLSMDFPGKNTGVGCRFLLQGISLYYLLKFISFRWNMILSNL